MVLFVFAHQDDEIAAASRIAYEVASGATVFCVFLTDGASKTPAVIRNAESVAVLTSLGVQPSNIAFIGSDIGIADGRLVEHLDRALTALDVRLRGVNVETIYCLAWEGGHQDHDASHLVALAFAKRRALLDRCFEVPLYRGWGRLFRVLSPIARESWQRRRITFTSGLRFSMLAWKYPSQRFSWAGLFPETFLKLALFRRELVRRVDPSRVRTRPHPGWLLYERRFKFPYDRFAQAAAPFIEVHL